MSSKVGDSGIRDSAKIPANPVALSHLESAGIFRLLAYGNQVKRPSPVVLLYRASVAGISGNPALFFGKLNR